MVALAMATLTMATLPMKARLFAMGNAYHRACFRCACCQSEIGDRRFVPHDGELWRHEPIDRDMGPWIHRPIDRAMNP